MVKVSRWDLLRVVASTLCVAASIVGGCGGDAVGDGVAQGSAGSRVVTGTVTLAANEVFEILPPEPGKVFFGHVTIRGIATAPNDPSKYDLQVTVGGQGIHLTGGPTHMPATRDQSAHFVGESLQVHNFSNLVAAPGYDITIVFAVAFERQPVP